MVEPRLLLEALYKLMNVTTQIEVDYVQDPDGSWIVELIPDGKVIDREELGYGLSKEEALNDACQRFFNITPTLSQVPMSSLLKLISGDLNLLD